MYLFKQKTSNLNDVTHLTKYSKNNNKNSNTYYPVIEGLLDY